MESINLIPIGKTGKAHGIEGEINAFLTIDYQTFSNLFSGKAQFCFIKLNALPVPFCIIGFRTKGEQNNVLLKFKQIHSRQEAEKIQNSELLLEANLLTDDVEFTASHFIGFDVYDQGETFIGKVVAVDDATINILFEVERTNGSTILLPVVDELVRYIEPAERKIGLIIPEGLL